MAEAYNRPICALCKYKIMSRILYVIIFVKIFEKVFCVPFDNSDEEHLQRLPISYYDRTPLGDIISRCTADVETVSTLFTTATGSGAVASSGGGAAGTSGATVLMGAVRLVTVGAAMIVLSPILSLVAAFTAIPVVLVTRYFQVRVRDAERDNRQAVGLQNTHLQETLGGIEVIRAQGSEATFIARFRSALRQGLEAHNRTAIYSSLYVPLMVILSVLAMGLVLWVGVVAQDFLVFLDPWIPIFAPSPLGWWPVKVPRSVPVSLIPCALFPPRPAPFRRFYQAGIAPPPFSHFRLLRFQPNPSLPLAPSGHSEHIRVSPFLGYVRSTPCAEIPPAAQRYARCNPPLWPLSGHRRHSLHMQQ